MGAWRERRLLVMSDATRRTPTNASHRPHTRGHDRPFLLLTSTRPQARVVESTSTIGADTGSSALVSKAKQRDHASHPPGPAPEKERDSPNRPRACERSFGSKGQGSPPRGTRAPAKSDLR